MVAQITAETFTRASQIPRPDPDDSDDVLLPLETARALEAQGEFGEAARWLRRAAEQAETEGKDARVVAFALAAADLANTIGSTSPPAAALSSIPPAPRTPTLAKPSQPTVLKSAPARVSSPPPLPTRAPLARPPTTATSSQPVSPSRVTLVAATSRVSCVPPTPRTATPRTAPTPAPLPREFMRVAIPASGRDANVFVVRKLTQGQPLPPGTKEARLVLITDDDAVDGVAK